MRARFFTPLPLFACAVVATLIVSGCATHTTLKSACEETDWYATGVDDGSHGLPLVQLDEHRVSCAVEDAMPDEAAYLLGRLEGLETFCTIANGTQVGQSGGVYSGACPAGSEFYFLTGFRLGHEMHRLDRSIDHNRRSAGRLQSSLEKHGVDQATIRGQLARLDVDYDRLMERAAFLEAETQRVTVQEAYAQASAED